GPVRVTGDRFRVEGDGAPEVGDVAVRVVDGLNLSGSARSLEQRRVGAKQRLDVVVDVGPKVTPEHVSDARLAAKPGVGRLESFGVHSTRSTYAPPLASISTSRRSASVCDLPRTAATTMQRTR